MYKKPNEAPVSKEALLRKEHCPRKAYLDPKLINRSLMLSAQMREINQYLPAIKVPLKTLTPKL